MDRPMRRGDREMVRALVHAVLEHGTWGVLATVDDDGQPYGVPVNYVFDGEESILIHGAPEGHKLANLRGNPRASFTVVSRAETLPEEFTTAFESVIAFGRATELAGEEKRSALVRLRRTPGHGRRGCSRRVHRRRAGEGGGDSVQDRTAHRQAAAGRKGWSRDARP